MARADGVHRSTEAIIRNGPDRGRFVVAILGDGFTDAELRSFKRAAKTFADTLGRTEPFGRLWGSVNIYRVDIASAESGADDPSSNTRRRTFLDATYGTGGLARLLTVNTQLAIETANLHVPAHDVVLVIVNDRKHGGSGTDKVAVYSLARNAIDIAIHEMGHSAFGLADEYEYYRGCDQSEPDHHQYTGSDPSEPNVTSVADLTRVKWRRHFAAGQPVPVTASPNCAHCMPGRRLARGVGLFVGARYFHCGIYRPEADCLMRTIGAGKPFCAVCRERIEDVLAGRVVVG